MVKKSRVGLMDSVVGMVVVLIMVVVAVDAYLTLVVLIRLWWRAQWPKELLNAVCLDGSPPGYHFDKGFGKGVHNWIVFFEGGAWCNNVATCSARKKTLLGSSNYMDKTVTFSGFLGNNKAGNQDFYNWNRIMVRYCDGASFTGDEEAVNPTLLSGCSAGGLVAILNCDNFRTLMPKTTKVKCLADAGFFIDGKDVFGTNHIRSFFNGVVTLQVKNILAPDAADLHGTWHSCKLNIKKCSSQQLKTMQGFRLKMLDPLKAFEKSPSWSMYINSCYVHCQTVIQDTWLNDNSPRLHNKSIAKAVGDWYFDRRMKTIDCPYPCDSTCHNQVFED